MNSILERYYQEDSFTEKDVLLEVNKEGSFDSLVNFLLQIAVVPDDRSDKGMFWRLQFLSEKTINLIISLINHFGDTKPKEVINAISKLEYPVPYRICEKYNLLDYLIKHIDTVKAINNQNVWRLLSISYTESMESIYGQKLRVSVGSLGLQYEGFHNEVYSLLNANSETPSLYFYNRISLPQYDIEKLGEKLHISAELVEELKQIEVDRRTEQDKRNQSMSSYHYNSIPKNRNREEKYKNALEKLAKVINQHLQTSYPNYRVKVNSMFETREDVSTDYYLDIYKHVCFKDNYNSVIDNLKETLLTMRKIELDYFSTETLSDWKLKLLKEFPVKELSF